MRIAVVGCGGIGGVIAARLTRAGMEVAPVTGNAQIAEALATHGYRVREPSGESWAVPPSRPPLVEAAGGPYDGCIMATKSTTLAGALHAMAPHLAPGAPVLVCQNGLPERLAAEVVGEHRVLGGIVVWGASMEAPGVYACTSKGKGSFKVGKPFPSSPDPAPVARVLEAVAPVTIIDDLEGARWSKLAINCATSTIGAIGGDRLGPLMLRRFVRRLVLELWTEIAAVARAAGVRPSRVAGVDLMKMALSPAERAAALGSPALAGKHALLMAVGVKYRRMRSSMLIALERKRTPEIDYLNGEVVHRGAALGVPTPVNARLVRAVMDIVAGRERSSLEYLRRVYEDVMAASRGQDETTRRLAA